MPVVLRASANRKNHAVVGDESDPALKTRDRLNHQIQQTQIECVPIGDLKPNRSNARKHPARQIALLAENYEKVGFTQPLIIDEDGMILCGHGRYQAALKLGLTQLPAIRLSGLSPAEKRALAIADNRLAEFGEWELELLEQELEFLFDPKTDLSFDPGIIGFEMPGIDAGLEGDVKVERADLADLLEPPDPDGVTVTLTGDLWMAGTHKLQCGSALEIDCYRQLLAEQRAAMVFSDVPTVYNDDNLRGEAREVAPEGLVTALNRTVCDNILRNVVGGCGMFFGSDWQYLQQLRATADPVFNCPENLIVWVKTKAGLGDRYWSQHQMILLYIAPDGLISDEFPILGQRRRRSDVWKYPRFDPSEALATEQKPVAMVVDALRDGCKRGGTVLDPFGGLGTTMVAAERSGRRARLIESNPLDCDRIIRRWQNFSGKTARLFETNETFDEVRARRTPRGM